ncbi:redoxin family protein [Alphaproteobacteria bacterium HT1-32]|nr:redoxin family protein [Alphaproteobacteria bacterium HT1-32]|tara:strand:- start:22538 stop:23116 length:579 start_codon:yes stop_codon:yes gene_type:complete
MSQAVYAGEFRMIPLIRAIAILLIMTPALAVAGPPKNYERLDSETSLPSDSFTNGLGVEMQLGDFHGKVVLLNLWATWCGPCVREMPHLDKLQAMLGGADFEVVALSSDRGGVEKVEPFFRRTNVDHLEIYLDPKNRIARALGARGLPTTYIIDAEGRLLGSVAGALDWTAPEIVDWLKGIIARRQEQALAG